MENFLAQHHLQRFPIPGDGNCLFASFLDQCKLHRVPQYMYSSVDQLKDLINGELVRNWAEHSQFFPGVALQAVAAALQAQNWNNILADGFLPLLVRISNVPVDLYRSHNGVFQRVPIRPPNAGQIILSLVYLDVNNLQHYDSTRPLRYELDFGRRIAVIPRTEDLTADQHLEWLKEWYKDAKKNNTNDPFHTIFSELSVLFETALHLYANARRTLDEAQLRRLSFWPSPRKNGVPGEDLLLNHFGVLFPEEYVNNANAVDILVQLGVKNENGELNRESWVGIMANIRHRILHRSNCLTAIDLQNIREFLFEQKIRRDNGISDIEVLMYFVECLTKMVQRLQSQLWEILRVNGQLPSPDVDIARNVIILKDGSLPVDKLLPEVDYWAGQTCLRIISVVTVADAMNRVVDIRAWSQYAHPLRSQLLDLCIMWDQLIYWLALKKNKNPRHVDFCNLKGMKKLIDETQWPLFGCKKGPQNGQAVYLPWAQLFVKLRMQLFHNHGCLYEEDFKEMAKVCKLSATTDIKEIIAAFRLLVLGYWFAAIQSVLN